jgi:RNA-directed DNA polymerase
LAQIFYRPRAEARKTATEADESRRAAHTIESPASTNRLMEEVCERETLREALRGVKANQGSPGVDGMTIDGITDYLKQHWPAIRNNC